MQTITLNLIPNGIAERVYVNQFDVNREFAIRVYDGTTGYTVPSADALHINGRKADNCIFDYGAVVDEFHVLTVTNNQIIVHTTQQMVAAAGECLCQIVIDSGGHKVGTLNFIMDVQGMPAAEGDDSESDLPDIIALATTQMIRAEAAAVSATASQTAAAGSATNAATSETNAATSASNAADSEAEAKEAARIATLAELNPPYINRTTGHWMVFDTSTNQYVDSGVDADISVTIDGITMLAPDATPSVTDSGEAYDHIYHLNIPRGKGISSIVKTGTSGLVDTYTITYSDGYTSTFTVTNGKTAYQSAVEGGYEGTDAEFEDDLAHFGQWAEDASEGAEAAADSAEAAADSADAAAASASLAEEYAGFTIPLFVMDGNKLYVDDNTVPEWKVENNRLYVKTTGANA